MKALNKKGELSFAFRCLRNERRSSHFAMLGKATYSQHKNQIATAIYDKAVY
jgi:hypothetical protein